MSRAPSRKRALRELAGRAGLQACDLALLDQALTHDSYACEQARGTQSMPSYERLEFLGDAVLGAVVASWLYQRHPQEPEGTLSRMRASLVSRSALARSAERLNLGALAQLGRGEAAGGGARKPPVLAAMFEALVGAAFLAGGTSAAERFVRQHHLAHAPLALTLDPKSALQEYAQARYKKAPHYAVIAQQGPAHARIFTVQVDVAGQVVGTGTGSTKKQAESQAAQEALSTLRQPLPTL